MLFSDWSVRLLEHYFSPGLQGTATWLSASPEELDEIGHDLGGDAGFLAAIESGPEWLGRGGDNWLREHATLLCRQWKREVRRPPSYVDPGARAHGMTSVHPAGLDAPPFLPYLVLFARVWHEKGAQVTAAEGKGYYACLQRLVGVKWRSSDLAAMEPLWTGLVDWANSHGGRFGTFSVPQMGGYNKIGVPQAQVLVTPKEVSRIQTIFGRSRLQPGRPLKIAELSLAVKEAAADEGLSAGLREVLGDETNALFKVATERMRGIFDEWDGEFFDYSKKNFGTELASATSQNDKSIDVGVALVFGTNGDDEWSVHLHVSGVQRFGEISAHGSWFTEVLTIPVRDERGGQSIEPVASLLTASSEIGRFVTLSAPSGDWSAQAHVSHRPVRYLAREDALDPSGRAMPCLVERSFANHGEIFFLVAPMVRDNFAHFSRLAERAKIQPVTSAGLPSGWEVFYCASVADISPEALEVLPDGRLERNRGRVVRFVGGLQVRSGGARLYMPYDLPIVEVDAPADAVLTAAGLDLAELPSISASHHELPSSVACVRRYEITSYDPSIYTYRIEVHGAVKQSLGSARLRLSAREGLLLSKAAKGGLDRFGEWIQFDNAPHQLLGIDLRGDDSDGSLVANDTGLPPGPTRPIFQAANLDVLDEHPAAQFLDYLAHASAGRLSMGRATQVARQILDRACPTRAVNIPLALFKMRSRGLVELHLDRIGRMVSVHAAEPCVYTLPASFDGAIFAALGGAISRNVVSRLRAASLRGIKVGVFQRSRCAQLSPLDLPGIILRATSIEVLRDALRCQDVDLRLVEHPSRTILRWAASLGEHARSLDGLSNGPRSTSSVQTYFAPDGRFVPASWTSYAQLYRIDESTSSTARLYGMRYKQNDEEWRYAPIARTWGTWHALLAAYKALCPVVPGTTGNVRVPLPYDDIERAIWVPASLGLPVVLERCLTLCSGQMPLEFRLKPGDLEGVGRIWVADASTNEPLFHVSTFFEGFFRPAEPGDPFRHYSPVWLKYPFIPRDVAARVAELLGATLD